MHRIDGPAAAPGGHFTDGDPNTGTPSTIVTQAWAEAVQEEIAAVIESTGVALAKPNNHQLVDAIKSLVSSALPPGAIQAFAVSAAPAGWLVADGSAVSSTAYPALAAALGTTWGAAPAGQFRLPDLRGEFLRGTDAGRNVDPGRVVGSSQDWATAAPKQTNPTRLGGGGLQYGGGNPSAVGFARASRAGEAVTASGFDSNGSGIEMDACNVVTGDTETRPRNIAVLFCIKT